MLITLSFDKFASHFCRTLKLRVMNQNSGVGNNSRSFSFNSGLKDMSSREKKGKFWGLNFVILLSKIGERALDSWKFILIW